MASEIKTGAGCAVIIVVMLIVPLVAFSLFGRIINNAANERAAAIRAQAELEVATAVGRQMDAATAAVYADTAVAHDAVDKAATMVLIGGLSLALVAAIVSGVALLYNTMARQVAELTAIVARMEAERREVAEKAADVSAIVAGDGYGV